MYRQALVVLFSSFTLISCSGAQESKEAETTPATAEMQDSISKPAEAPAEAPQRSFTTKGGKVIDIVETHPMGMSMSDITVTGHGFADSMIIMKDENPVSDVLEADLDKDGFNEYYIITTAAGSGSYGSIVGIASVRDKSLARISVAEFKEPADYMGHDSFKIEGDKLTRSYPAYKDKDTNASPSGETKTITYSLKQTAPGKYSLDQLK